MTSRTVVWAWYPLDELNGATGLVECDVALAATLIAADAVQDPGIGARLLRPVGSATPRRAAPPAAASTAAATSSAAASHAEPSPAGRAARKVLK